MAKDPGVDSLIARSPGGYWGNHEYFEDWQNEVANNNTRLGFWEWLFNENNLEGPKKR